MGAGLFKLPSTRRWGDTSSLRFLSRRLHCEPMRQRLQWTWMVALAILFTHRPVRAESPANSPSMPVQQSDACARRLHEIYDEAARLEEKTPPEQAALADCVRSRALKIKGLLALMEETQKDIRQAVQAAQSDKTVDYVNSVKICCARAEKLLLEAEGCATSLALKAAPPPEASLVATNAPVLIDVKITPRPPSPPVKRRFVERTIDRKSVV